MTYCCLMTNIKPYCGYLLRGDVPWISSLPKFLRRPLFLAKSQLIPAESKFNLTRSRIDRLLASYCEQDVLTRARLSMSKNLALTTSSPLRWRILTHSPADALKSRA